MRGVKVRGKRNLIAGFFCSHHFLEMVWKRKIEVSSLEKFLSEIPGDRPVHFCYIIPLKRRTKQFENALVIKIEGKLLVTAYFTHLESYMGRNKADHFVLSQSKY